MKRSVTSHVIGGVGRVGGERVESGSTRRMMELQRRYRQLENEKRSFNVETNDVLRKQKVEMEVLERERRELQLLESSSLKRDTRKAHSSLRSLTSKQDHIRREIEEERRKQRELEDKIGNEKKKSKRLMNLACSVAKRSSNNNSYNNNSYNNHVDKLEDQLQLAKKRFGKVLDSNKELRADIQNLRSERMRFDRLIKKMERRRKQLQEETIDVIHASNMTHKQREEAQEKTRQLEERTRRDVKQFWSESKEMERVLKCGESLEDFMETKFARRDDDEKMREWRERKGRVIQEKKKTYNDDDKHTYEAALRNMQAITGKEDGHEIINKFLLTEDDNFGLFNFVNNQSEVVDKMLLDVNQLSKEIGCLKGSLSSMKTEKKEQVEKDGDEMGKMLIEMEGRQQTHQKLTNILEKLSREISQLYEETGCENEEDGEKLREIDEGKDERMNEEKEERMKKRMKTDLLIQLSSIEDRTDQLTLNYLLFTAKAGNHTNDQNVDNTSKKSLMSSFSKLLLPPLQLPTLISDRGRIVSDSKRSVNFKSAKRNSNKKNINNNNDSNNQMNNNNEEKDDDVLINTLNFDNIKKNIWVDDNDDNNINNNKNNNNNKIKINKEYTNENYNYDNEVVVNDDGDNEGDDHGDDDDDDEYVNDLLNDNAHNDKEGEYDNKKKENMLQI